ncbi:MAG: preprotein translocase subunit SecG [Patescibacteria group bacterium]
MQNIIATAQIAVSVLMIAAILLQQKGVGLGAAFGGDGASFRTKRGLEKGLFYATIVLAATFLGLGLALIIVS